MRPSGLGPALIQCGREKADKVVLCLHDLILYWLGRQAGWLAVCFYFKPPAQCTKPIYLLTAAASELFLVLTCLAYFSCFLCGSNSTTLGLRSLLNWDLYSNPSLIYISNTKALQCLFSRILSFRKLDQ